MSEATTGVEEAKASVSTMPKLSPPSDGAQRMSASPEQAPLLLVGHAPGHVHALGVEQQGRDLLLGGAGHGEPGVHAGDAQRLEGAQQDGQALAGLGAARRTAARAARRRACGAEGIAAARSTPLGTIR